MLTNRPLTIPPELNDRVEVQAGTPSEIMARLAAHGDQHIYLDGGATIQNFLRAGFVDQLIITTIPVLIGQGVNQVIQLSRIRLGAVAFGLMAFNPKNSGGDPKALFQTFAFPTDSCD